MNDFRFRLLIMLFLFALCTGALLSYSTNDSSQVSKYIISSLPLEIENWRGENLQVSEDVFRILQTQFIVVREYRNHRGGKVTLAVIYYPDNQISFHAPEARLGGVGYTIIQEEIKTLKFSAHDSLQVKTLHYNRNHTHELIYYFYQTNNFVTPNYLTFRWQMLLNQLKHKRTNGALIRVSTPVQPNSPAEKILQDFLTKVFPTLNKFIKLDVT